MQENEILEPQIEGVETEVEVPEITLDALKEGRITFRELPKAEKLRLTAEARESLPDDEAREAWDMGWRSKEFFGGKRIDGSTKEFVDYKDYLKKINEIAPVKNERLRAVAKENEDLRKTVEETKAEMRKLLEIQKMAQERTILSEEEKIAQELKDAEEFGDVGKYKAAEAKRQTLQLNKEKLKELEPTETTPSPQQIRQQLPAEVLEWTAKNPWFYENQELQRFSIAQSQLLEQNRPDLTLNQRLTLVEQVTRTTYPDYFPQVRQAVLPSRNAGTFSKPKEAAITFDSLSEAEKRQAEQAIRQGIFKDKADVMKSYNLVNKK